MPSEEWDASPEALLFRITENGIEKEEMAEVPAEESGKRKFMGTFKNCKNETLRMEWRRKPREHRKGERHGHGEAGRGSRKSPSE